MEALLEREEKVENWNDDRMDELSRRVDAGFAAMATKDEMNLRFDQVDQRFDEIGARFDRFEGSVGSRFDEVDARSDRFERSVSSRFNNVDAQLSHINDRLDRMNHTLLIGTLGVIAALIANGVFG